MGLGGALGAPACNKRNKTKYYLLRSKSDIDASHCGQCDSVDNVTFQTQVNK